MSLVTALYLRQSKDVERDELAISRQRAACLKLCRERGWANHVEYVDNDRSATNGKTRESYRRLLADIASGKVERVIATHQDRLHRDVGELLQFADVAVKHQLQIVTASGDIDLSSDDGEFMAVLGAALARKEVRRKSARQKAAAEQLATADGGGRPWWPHRPFGFDADRDPITGKWWTSKKSPTVYNEIRLHPIESRLIKDAYRDVLIGTSLYAIAQRWNDAKVPTPRGNQWVGTQVRYCLLAARNAGLRELNHEVVGPGTWPAIVSEEVWRQAVHMLSDPSRSTTASRGRKYLLSGLLACGRGCPKALVSQKGANGYRSYECRSCNRISRDLYKIDAIITKAVVDRLSQPDAADLLLPRGEEVDVVALREQRRALVDRLKQLGSDFKNAPIEFTRAAVAGVQADIDEIDAQLTDTEQADIFEGVIGADDVAAAFGGLDLGRKRTIIDALMAITVLPIVKGSGRRFNPDAIDVQWK